MKRVPGKYTRGEEIANAVTHVVGSHLGAAMLALLVWQGVTSGVDVGWKVTSASIFGFSMILLYAVSSAYHTVTYPPAKRVLHVMDHMAIYFLIAGSYTPFCLVMLRPKRHKAERGVRAGDEEVYRHVIHHVQHLFRRLVRDGMVG